LIHGIAGIALGAAFCRPYLLSIFCLLMSWCFKLAGAAGNSLAIIDPARFDNGLDPVGAGLNLVFLGGT